MNELSYTLLSDGSSDKTLMPILTWLLQQHIPNLPIQPNWSDLRRVPTPPKELFKKIQKSIELYPCDLLFVHRDAENAPLEERVSEITQAVSNANVDRQMSAVVCVVPIRMTEAWLLFEINAIRQAAGNPNGTVPLDIPPLSDVENLPNPKRVLRDKLRKATELSAHRKERFNTNRAIQRIPEYIEDFSSLRSLSAFIALEDELKRTIESQCWDD